MLSGGSVGTRFGARLGVQLSAGASGAVTSTTVKCFPQPARLRKADTTAAFDSPAMLEPQRTTTSSNTSCTDPSPSGSMATSDRWIDLGRSAATTNASTAPLSAWSRYDC